jgi:hypothetical protein
MGDWANESEAREFLPVLLRRVKAIAVARAMHFILRFAPHALHCEVDPNAYPLQHDRDSKVPGIFRAIGTLK